MRCAKFVLLLRGERVSNFYFLVSIRCVPYATSARRYAGPPFAAQSEFLGRTLSCAGPRRFYGSNPPNRLGNAPRVRILEISCFFRDIAHTGQVACISLCVARAFFRNTWDEITRGVSGAVIPDPPYSPPAAACTCGRSPLSFLIVGCDCLLSFCFCVSRCAPCFFSYHSGFGVLF